MSDPLDHGLSPPGHRTARSDLGCTGLSGRRPTCVSGSEARRASTGRRSASSGPGRMIVLPPGLAQRVDAARGCVRPSRASPCRCTARRRPRRRRRRRGARSPAGSRPGRRARPRSATGRRRARRRSAGPRSSGDGTSGFGSGSSRTGRRARSGGAICSHGVGVCASEHVATPKPKSTTSAPIAVRRRRARSSRTASERQQRERERPRGELVLERVRVRASDPVDAGAEAEHAASTRACR